MFPPPSLFGEGVTYRAVTFTARTQTVERVVEAMHERLAEPLSLEEMAEIAYLSPFHFNRIFRSITGLPPGEFLAALRLDQAKRLLLTTPLSVTEVCYALGYSSLGTFTSRFKQLIGISPQQLRQIASEFTPHFLEPVRAPSHEVLRGDLAEGLGVNGIIQAPEAFSGLIFIGLFPKPIPQGGPVACCSIAAPGPFRLRRVPDGRYFLLAAALPLSHDTLTYLLPRSEAFVAIADQPVTVRAGRGLAPVHLALRAPRVTDPPILGVFPGILRSSREIGASRLP